MQQATVGRCIVTRVTNVLVRVGVVEDNGRHHYRSDSDLKTTHVHDVATRNLSVPAGADGAVDLCDDNAM